MINLLHYHYHPFFSSCLSCICVLRSDIHTCERQIEYIQKEKTTMKLSLPDSLPALRHIAADGRSTA